LYLFFSLQYMLCVRPSQHPWFDRRSYVCWSVRSMKRPVVFVSAITPCHFSPNVHSHYTLRVQSAFLPSC
jgi:hypothetical protein